MRLAETRWDWLDETKLDSVVFFPPMFSNLPKFGFGFPCFFPMFQRFCFWKTPKSTSDGGVDPRKLGLFLDPQGSLPFLGGRHFWGYGLTSLRKTMMRPGNKCLNLPGKVTFGEFEEFASGVLIVDVWGFCMNPFRFFLEWSHGQVLNHVQQISDVHALDLPPATCNSGTWRLGIPYWKCFIILVVTVTGGWSNSWTNATPIYCSFLVSWCGALNLENEIHWIWR